MPVRLRLSSGRIGPARFTGDGNRIAVYLSYKTGLQLYTWLVMAHCRDSEACVWCAFAFCTAPTLEAALGALATRSDQIRNIGN